ncbi:MAG TPA: MlaD family protein [Gammaproteobacteria bacterium]|nr:MlaD family protein [Gammaproteobacteria bacterium]
METDKNYFLVGLFVISMVLAGIGFSLWLGSAGKGDYNHYCIRFAESVSGLNKESAVKFRGVDIGGVEKISIDSKDSKLIQVNIRVLKSTPIKTDTTATLKLYGIAGEVYIDLSGGSHTAPELKAKNDELPEIPAKPSSIDVILNGLPRLLEKANHVAEQLSKIFSNENVRSVNSIARKLSKRFGDKED